MSFDFSGFEYRWIVDRSGTPRVQRRTSPQRFAASVRRVREWCRSQRSVRPVVFFALLNRKLVGYYNYYGVIGNYRISKAFFDEVERAVKRWLSRRSQKGRMSWKRVRALVRYHGLEKPRIVQSRIVPASPRDVLTAEARTTEEPGAGNPHAGICVGGAG